MFLIIDGEDIKLSKNTEENTVAITLYFVTVVGMYRYILLKTH